MSKSPDLFLEVASIEDARTLFDWRNDPEVRRQSINQDPIEWKTHLDWLERSLKNENRRIYLGIQNGLKAGTIRVDRLGSGELYLSWAVGIDHRGQGVGRKMLEIVCQQNPKDILLADIRKDNLASLHIAGACGFNKLEPDIQPGINRLMRPALETR